MKVAVRSAMSGKHLVGAMTIILDRTVEKHAENVVSIMLTPLHIYTHIYI